MSQGSPRRTMRFPQSTVDRIEQAINSANSRRSEVPYDWTGWVLQAVAEKLRSLERGRASARRRRPAGRPAAAPAGASSHQDLGAAHAEMSVI